MSTGVPSDSAIRESAAQWVQRLEGEVGDAVREEFHRWLLADERHERAYEEFVSLTVAPSDFAAEDQAALLASIAPPPAVAPAPRQNWRLAVAAATVIVLVATAWLVMPSAGLVPETFVTDTGENRTVKFEDGSVAYLNTRTRLEWIGNSRERRVALIEGEALFDVVHDEKRPFEVEVDNSEIQVRGTRFNVYRKASGEVVVTVLEGTVDVQEVPQGSEQPTWKRELHASQSIVYRPIGLMRDVHETNALNAVKWRDGLLPLDNEPLENVVDELTRYTNRRIVIRDPAIAGIPIGGSLRTRDVRMALDTITVLKPSIMMSERDGQFELSLRPEPPQREPVRN